MRASPARASTGSADRSMIRATVGSVAGSAWTVTEEVSRGPQYPGVVSRIRVAAAQLNLVVGDLDGNVERIVAAYDRAVAADCDLVAFPELAITGYPPEDLLLKHAFVVRAREALDKVAVRTGATAAIV